MHSFNSPPVVCEHGTVNVKCETCTGGSKTEVCKSIPEHNRILHVYIRGATALLVAALQPVATQ